jgi:hypothetical protein
MGHQRRWRRWLAPCLLAAGLAGSSGCLSFIHPLVPPQPEVKQPCLDVPRCCRDHVYVFLMNGLDPVNCGNLTGLRDYLVELGIAKTYYGQLYHTWCYEKELRRIQREDPLARFVLIGFSLGVNTADAVARAVRPDGISIDLLVFLSGNHYAGRAPTHRPENVGKVLNILADGGPAKWGQRDWAENILLPHTSHFGSPVHPVTLRLLAREMAEVAARVPVVEDLPPPLPKTPEQIPPPRSARERTAAKRGEWDFLKPVSTLGSPPGL